MTSMCPVCLHDIITDDPHIIRHICGPKATVFLMTERAPVRTVTPTDADDPEQAFQRMLQVLDAPVGPETDWVQHRTSTYQQLGMWAADHWNLLLLGIRLAVRSMTESPQRRQQARDQQQGEPE